MAQFDALQSETWTIAEDDLLDNRDLSKSKNMLVSRQPAKALGKKNPNS